MPITVSKQLKKRVKEASETLGIDEREIIRRAIELYLRDAREAMNLKQELNAWDRLSSESLRTRNL